MKPMIPCHVTRGGAFHWAMAGFAIRGASPYFQVFFINLFKNLNKSIYFKQMIIHNKHENTIILFSVSA